MSSRLGLLHLVLLLCLDAVAAAAAVALPGCRDSCGNISIPYPFGIGDGCFKEGFNLTCTSRQPAKLLLGDGTIQVLEILLDNVRIKSQVTVTTSVSLSSAWTGLVVDGPFTISVSRNKFTAIGCGILAYAVDPASPGGHFLAACASVCSGVTDAVGSCSGIGCCQTSVPSRVRSFGIQVRPLNQTSRWKSSSKVFQLNYYKI